MSDGSAGLSPTPLGGSEASGSPSTAIREKAFHFS
jgi:hypothetical protein